MIFKEKTVSSEEIFRGRIIKVKLDQVKMPDGSLAPRELVEHPGGVGVVAINDKDEVMLVQQYRKPIDKVLYEIPAGKLDPREVPLTCGKRELEEETGLTAKTFTYLGAIYGSPGFTDERTHIYLATGLTQGEEHPDPDEFLDVIKMPIQELLGKILANEISDAKTVVGVLKALALREGENHGE